MAKIIIMILGIGIGAFWGIRSAMKDVKYILTYRKTPRNMEEETSISEIIKAYNQNCTASCEEKENEEV